MTEFIEKRILPIAGKIQSNKILGAVSRTFLTLMPITIIGSLFVLILSLPLGEGYGKFIVESGLAGILNIPVGVTMDILALLVAIVLPYNLAKIYKRDGLVVGILGAICLLMITPSEQGVISKEFLGAKGIFTAMIVGMAVGILYNAILNKNIKIKLPESVPPMVAKPFESLIPTIFIATLFLIVRVIFMSTSFGSIHQAIYSLLQAPLANVGNTLPTFILVILISQILWFFGIHGATVTGAVIAPLFMVSSTANATALANGDPLPFILSGALYTYITCMIGGAGNTLGLGVLMAFTSKSERYKSLGKLGLPAGIFNINEPIIFGFPIIMNPAMAIPFILTPVINLCVAYGLIKFSIVGIPAVTAPWTTPAVFAGFLAGAGISFGLLMILLTFTSTLIYYPFFRACDKKAYEEELELAKNMNLNEGKISNKGGVMA